MNPDELLVRACWLGSPVAGVSDDDLRRALERARRNEVEPMFIRAYAERLGPEVAAVDEGVASYRRNLRNACARLHAAGVTPILIKALPDEEYTYSNFDLVVGDDGWDRAIAALRPWVVSTSRHPLERATKLLLYPASGPAVHLHREVAWFDIPAIPTDVVRARALPAGDGIECLLPGTVDALRILLAHAVFQNLALSLGELLTFRRLANPDVEAEARRLAQTEGWGTGYRSAVRTARTAAARLDRLEPVRLPVPLSIAASAVGGVEHALHLVRAGRIATSARELALRGPLIVAKRRAVYR